MAIRNIVQVGDQTLRKKCFEVTDFGAKTHQLLDDMKDTLKHTGGVGLAAPQVGILRRIFIVDYENVFLECINPVISGAKGKEIDREGCLSVKGKYGDVERPTKLTLSFQDRYGNAQKIKVEGYIARIICHENDHLDGILYIDKAISVESEG